MEECMCSADLSTLEGLAQDIYDRADQIYTIMEDNRAPGLYVPFEEYTVTETLQLLLIICIVVSWCARMLRRGFSWLL